MQLISMVIRKEHRDVIATMHAAVLPSRAYAQKIKHVQSSVLKKLRMKDATAVLGGSGAKNTWLEGANDIDVYVKFAYAKYKDKSQDISRRLYRHLRKQFPKISILHGSRDYFQIKRDGFTVEIVPILAIRKATEAKNITDFSQFHVRYVTGHIKKRKQLAQDIRLAKVLTKANNLYGAESHIKGFSGYVLELLVIHYKSFINLVRAAAQWKQTTVIGSVRAADRLNWAKKLSPLRLIDPVQPDRNAAAALSSEQYKKFITLCKRFMRKPAVDLFVPKDVDIARLKRKGHLLTITAVPTRKKKDVAGAKALKAFGSLVKGLDAFGVVDSVFDYRDGVATYYIVVQKKTLPKMYKQMGPPIDNTNAIALFRKAHKGVALRKDAKVKKYYVMLARQHTTVHDFLRALLERDEILSRITQIVVM